MSVDAASYEMNMILIKKYIYIFLSESCSFLHLVHLFLTYSLQVAFLSVIGRYGVQASIFIESFGTICFVMNIVSDLF